MDRAVIDYYSLPEYLTSKTLTVRYPVNDRNMGSSAYILIIPDEIW